MNDDDNVYESDSPTARFLAVGVSLLALALTVFGVDNISIGVRDEESSSLLLGLALVAGAVAVVALSYWVSTHLYKEAPRPRKNEEP